MHKGFVFILKVIPFVSNIGNKKINRWMVVSCGTMDNCVKMSIMEMGEKGAKMEEYAVVQMNSYCTSVSYVDVENILLGFRDGSLVLYDAKNKVKKYERLSMASCIKS